MKKRLYDEYLTRLKKVNDETKTEKEHALLVAELRAWRAGVEDAAGHKFNGDYYYIGLFDRGIIPERPLCCGLFLDWKSESERGVKK